jgi:polyisoprenoid-binding protein YceI
MMVSKVRGLFRTFEGSFTTAANPLESSVTATIDLTSIDTNHPDRDNDLRSKNFFETDQYPTMTYQSSGLRPSGDEYVLEGELSLHGVTKSVPLTLELNGFGPDGYGGTRVGFSATAEISRKDFGIDIHMPLDGGGVVIGDKISINLEIEAVLQA